MARFEAVYHLVVDGAGRFRREMAASRRDAERLERESSAARATTVREQREVSKANIDAARSHRVNAEAVGDSTTALDRFNKVHRETRKTTVNYKRDTDRMGAAMAAAGGEGRKLTNIFGALGGSMGKARQAGKNFGAVLKLLKFPAIIAAVHTLIGALSALAAGIAALIPNLVQASTILAGLPGIIAGLVQGVGVAVLGFKGLGDAVKALADQQQAAGETARELADTRRAAAITERDAIESVSDAQESLSDAQREQQEATEDLTEAREDALEALQDLRIEAERAEISEERAQLNLRRARRELRRLQTDPSVSPTDIDYRDAQLDVMEAELDLKDARNDNKRTADDLREAERKGINQSDQVVAARERLSDATEAVSDAETALTDAITGQSEAMRGNQEAMAGLTSEQQKLKEAFRALSPEARSFARYIFSLRPRLDELRQTAQKGLLPGAEAGLRAVMTLLPDVQDMVGRTSRILGDFFRRFGQQVSAPEFRTELRNIFRTNEYVIREAGYAGQDFVSALVDIVNGAEPVVRWLTRIVRRFGDWIARAAEAGEESGRMQDFFLRAIETAEQFGRIIADLAVGIFNFFREGRRVGDSLWDSIEEGAQTFRDFTESFEGRNKMRNWFRRAEPVVRNVAGLVGDLTEAFFVLAGDATSGLNPIITMLRTQLIPAIIDLGYSVASTFGPALIDTLSTIVELFARIGGQGGTLTSFLRVLDFFAETILWLIDHIPGFRTFMGIFFLFSGAAAAVSFLATVIDGYLIKNIVKLLGFANAIRTFIALWGIGGLAGALSAAATAAPALAGAITFLSRAIQIAMGPVGWITLALGTLALAIKSVIDRNNEIRKQGRDTTEHFIKQGKTLGDLRGHYENLNDIASEFQQAGYGTDLQEQFDIEEPAALARWNERVAEITENRLQNAEAEETYGDALRTTEGLTLDQIRQTSSLVNVVEEYGAGLDNQEEKSLKAAIAAGDMETILSILHGEFDEGTVRIEGYAAAFSEAEMRAEGFRRGIEGFRKPLTDIARISGQSYDELVTEGEQAFSESMEAGDEWIDSLRDNLREYRDQWRETFDTTDEVWQSLADNATVTSDDITEAFDDQTENLVDYRESWDELEERGAPRRFLEELADMGIEGQRYITALADGTEEDMDRAVAAWRRNQDAQKALGDDVADTLVPTLENLSDVLRDLEQTIKIALNLDTSKAQEGLEDFIEKLRDQGMTLEGAHRRGHLLSEEATPRGSTHEGGVPNSGPVVSGPPRSGEVDTRLLRSEFVMSPGAVKGAGGPAAMYRLQKGFERRRFHEGGLVGDADPVTSRLQVVRDAFKAGQVRATLKRKQRFKAGPKWGVPAPTYDETGGPGRQGATSAMTGMYDWVKKNFDVRGFLGVGHTYTGTTGYSQHAYGNAVDFFGKASEMMKLFTTVARMASSKAIRNLGHIIHAAKKWSYNGGAGPYTPPAGTNDYHYGHVHIDMLPQYEGRPPGRPVPPHSYHEGGYVDAEGMAHRGEFVLRARAARAIGLANLAALNAASGAGAGPLPIRDLSPAFRVPAAAAYPDMDMTAAGSESVNQAGAGRPDSVTLRVDLDGKTLVETHRVHQREVRLRVGGRTPSRTGAN